uniref:PDZ/DHR/GLGF domaincontaining protein n=1 Tax=Rhipicephalus appendiculatus TaxID=34631 RepID=A0A131YZL2_RHIAP
MSSLCSDRPSLDSSLKAFMAELVRAPSPDSACEQDEPWSPLARVAGKQGASTEASGEDTQSECSDASNQASSSSVSANRSSPTSANDEYAGAEIRASQRRVPPPPPGRTSAPVHQDSDGDSGIDGSVERFSQRVGSTSSADTEPSSCNDGPVERHQLHESATPSGGGNDGGARTSFVAGPPRVHFDEGLPFSEQHMRRSCRQLMAALYASSSTGAQLDPRSAGRYRSFSLPVRAFEEDESFKRLSVPAARTLPSSFDLDGRSSGAKLSVAPMFVDVSAPSTKWSGSRRSSVPPDSSPALSPADSNDSRRLDHEVPAPSESSTNKHPAYCISATFKCSKGIASSLKDAAVAVNSKYPGRGVSSSAQYVNEADFVDGNVGQSSHVRQEHHPLGGTSRGSLCESPSRDQGMTNKTCSEEARISEPWRTTSDLRTAQPVRTAPREAVVSRVQPTRPVSSHSTSSLSGPKPKTTLPPKALPLSLPGPAKVVKGGVEYAVVTRKPSYHHAVLSPIPRITSSPCVMDDAEPPLPPRKAMHKSDFGLYYGPASSTSSLNGGAATANGSASHGGSTPRLLDRVQGIGRSARSALLRAFSTERIYRPQKTETAAVARDLRREFLDSNLGVNRAAPLASPSPSPSTSSTTSLVMGLKARMSLRKSKRRPRQEATGIQINTDSDPLWTGGHPTHVSAQLLQQNLDGTQVVELRRPPGRSFGFFLARGRVHAHHGVFVSRMPDAHTQQVLQGLLDIGDEILEVNGTDVRDADIMKVNSLMTNQSTLLLTVLPYICRKDI